MSQSGMFDFWNVRKKQIQDTNHNLVNFSEREIWWCALGKNIGNEEDGKNELFERPVLVLRKFSKYTAVVLPLTTKGKDGSPFYYGLLSSSESFVILSQVRLISSKRLLRKMYRLGRRDFENVKHEIKKLIFS